MKETSKKATVLANYNKGMAEGKYPAYRFFNEIEDAAPIISVGALWDAELLRLMFTFDAVSRIEVEVGGFKQTVTSIGDGHTCSLDISFSDIGISPKYTGQLIPVKMEATCGGPISLFDGEIRLSDYISALSSDGTDIGYFSNTSISYDGNHARTDEQLGIESKNGSIHMFSKHIPSVPNVRNICMKLEKDGLPAADTYLFEADIVVNELTYPGVFDPHRGNFGFYKACFEGHSKMTGFAFNFTGAEDTRSPLFAIANKGTGLELFICNNRVLFGGDGMKGHSIPLGKKVGEPFHLSFEYTNSTDFISYFNTAMRPGTMTLKVDGKLVCVLERVGEVREFAPSTFTVSFMQEWSSNTYQDNFDVEFKSLSISVDNEKNISDNISIDKICGDGLDVTADGERYVVCGDLALDGILENEYGTSPEVIWRSSRPDVIAHDGKVTAPLGSGEAVDLDMSIVDRGETVAAHTFKLFVKGTRRSEKVMWVPDDYNPFLGRAVTADSSLVLDRNTNSIVYDMGEVTKVNRVKITSMNDIGFVNKNYISIYVSKDNESYDYVKDYSAFARANELYLYNFDAEARYIKVHSTHDLDSLGNIENSPESIMYAEYTDEPLLASGDFKKGKRITLKNDTDKTVYDKIVCYTLSELGIKERDVKSDKSDVRFLCDGKYLPHYYHDGAFWVRVLKIEPNSTATVRALWGNENAESVSDGNETFEIQYGTKRMWDRKGGWTHTVEQFPNGDVVKVAAHYGGIITVFASTDGGHTWEVRTPCIEEARPAADHFGLIVDHDTGEVFIFTIPLEKGEEYEDEAVMSIFSSKDNGYTWSHVQTITAPFEDARQFADYSSGIKLSSADGDGPEVDYVWTGHYSVLNASGGLTSIYSRDGGKTWQFSESKINYPEPIRYRYEYGNSETTVFENKEGVLVMLCRCEYPDVAHFGMALSYDKGVTWEEMELEKSLTNIYASNAQPIVEKMPDGTPVLMWPGNNSFGCVWYIRHPLNVAYTEDGYNFTGIVDTSVQTRIATADRGLGEGLITNEDMKIYEYRGVTMCFSVPMHPNFLITDFDSFLYKTKGAFDSFENGIDIEGWLTVPGGLTYIDKIGATDGDYAMSIREKTVVMRTIHYIEEGSVSFDLYVKDFGLGWDLELQSAYNEFKGVTAPIRLHADGKGELSSYVSWGENTRRVPLGLSLKEGQNSLAIEFDGNAERAFVTLNGKRAELTYISGMTVPAVSYATIFTDHHTEIAIDRFTAIKKK